MVDIDVYREVPPKQLGPSRQQSYRDARSVPKYRTYSVEQKGTITVSWDLGPTPKIGKPKDTVVSLVIDLTMGRYTFFRWIVLFWGLKVDWQIESRRDGWISVLSKGSYTATNVPGGPFKPSFGLSARSCNGRS